MHDFRDTGGVEPRRIVHQIRAIAAAFDKANVRFLAVPAKELTVSTWPFAYAAKI